MDRRIIALSLTIVLACLDSTAQDWSQWRGPNRDGVIAGTAIPEVWPEQLHRVWRLEVGEGHSSPLKVGNRIYVFVRQDDQEQMRCLSLQDGKTLWQDQYAAPYSLTFAAYSHGKGPKSTPVIADDKIVALGIGGILSCWHVGNGQLLWRKTFDEEFKKSSPHFGSAVSPLISNGWLIVHAGGHDSGALMAIDLTTSAVKWRWAGDGPGYASPVILTIDSVAQVVTQSQQQIIGVELLTGSLLWQMPFTTPYVQNIVTPIIHDNDLILSGLSNGTMRVHLSRKDGSWSKEKLWHNEKVSFYMSTPIVVDGLLFGLAEQRKGQFVALQLDNGEMKWQSQGREGDYASIVRAGDTILILNTEGKLFIVAKDDEAFQTIREYAVADASTWAHLTVFDQKLLVKDEKTLSLWRLGSK